MSEITKLYELARANRDCNTYSTYRECPFKTRQCEDCENFVYPPFTAEKVIRLLEWESNRGIIDIKHSQKGYQIFTYIHTGNYGKSIIDAVASYFCVKWQDLTEEEKQQIKEILE